MSIADDLTPTERIALLALWRYLHGERKPIGPALLAGLIGVARDTARIILRDLRHKGYVGCDGSRERKTGKAAERWLTDHIKWPASKRKVGTGIPTPEVQGVGTTIPGYNHTRVQRYPGTAIPLKVGTGIPADLGVRQAAPTSEPDTGLQKEGDLGGDEVHIADLLCGEGES
ncbi:MAG: hypothetical protein KAY37_16010 [Phycisphaerae bacterium]|nr:hypothetical protein [Phycisphaerae bacterium]